MQAHEKPAGALLTQTPDGAPALFLEAGSDLNLRDLPGREHAEQQRRRERRQQDERSEQAEIENERHVKIGLGLRHHPTSALCSTDATAIAATAPVGGQRQTLGDELADEASAARAQRQAEGNLGFAGGAARKEQIGEIRARNQQQHADGREQRRQRL